MAAVGAISAGSLSSHPSNCSILSSSYLRRHLRSLPSPTLLTSERRRWQGLNSIALVVSGPSLALAAYACAFPFTALAAFPPLEEPSNALSLPTWAIHVSSVIEWVIAMALVWEYGEKSGFKAWKGLSWGMVPLLGGAMCACTWHFFYNSESLEKSEAAWIATTGHSVDSSCASSCVIPT